MDFSIFCKANPVVMFSMAPSEYRKGVVDWFFQWIGLLGKILTGNHGFYHEIVWVFRLKFSHHPIPWIFVVPFPCSIAIVSEIRFLCCLGVISRNLK